MSCMGYAIDEGCIFMSNARRRCPMRRPCLRTASWWCLSWTTIALMLTLQYSYVSAFDLSCRKNARLHTRTLRMTIDDGGGGGGELLTRSEATLRALAYPLGAAAAFRAGAAVSVVGQPRMPPASDLPGPHRTIGSRIVRLPASGARVRVFYPSSCADESSAVVETKHAPYCTDGRATSDGMAGLVGFRQLGLSFLLAHLADADSGCLEDAPPDRSTKAWPLLVYSHGYGGNFDMATYFFRTLASMGMIVAAVEHTDGTASSTVLPDGNRLEFSPSLLSGREQLDRRAMELLEAATLSNLPTDFAIDSSRLFLGGHSYGAPSSILAASQAPTQKLDIAGLILHDPALGMGYGRLSGLGSILETIPTVSYTSDEYNAAGVRFGDLTLHCRGAFHGNFVDAPLWAPPIVMRTLSLLIPAAGPADPVCVHNALAESASAFMLSLRPVYGDDTASGDSDLFEMVS